MQDLTSRLIEDLHAAKELLSLFRGHPSSEYTQFLKGSIAELETRLAQSVARDEEQQRVWAEA